MPVDATAVQESISEAAQSVEDHQQLNSELAALDLNFEDTECCELSASHISIVNLLNVDGQSSFTHELEPRA